MSPYGLILPEFLREFTVQLFTEVRTENQLYYDDLFEFLNSAPEALKIFFLS